MQTTDAIYSTATVPEHSVDFIRIVSGGECAVQDGYVYYAADDWLTIIGYPLGADPLTGTTEAGLRAFEDAKNQAVKKTGATQCFAVLPALPESLQQVTHVEHVEQDAFYTLPASASVPPRLRRVVKKARERLRLDVGTTFTNEHRRLWIEFLGRAEHAKTSDTVSSSSSSSSSSSFSGASLSGASPSGASPMTPMVKHLFVTVPSILGRRGTDLRLLNAWDSEGHLAATLLVDFAPRKFCAYILGAHSRTHYTPHAADMLFAHMISLAQAEGKEFIHLGVGVNEGIARFKRKWGGLASIPFMMVAWKEAASARSTLTDGMVDGMNGRVAHMYDDARTDAALLMSLIGQSKQQIFASFPEQRPFAMLWRVAKGDRISWIGGSAHFFCYSFERAFRKLFDKVDNVLFEGPLDAGSLREVSAEGVRLTPEQQPLRPLLTEDEVRLLERVVRGPEGRWARLLNMEAKRRVDVRWYLENARPWTALFTLWTGFLERKGWQQSVDLEGWRIAHNMGKNVVAMESLEEQLASLDSVPPERVVRYFQNCKQWSRMIEKNVTAYLRGDLLRLMGTSAEFPTRTHTIISLRDERFRQRMRPFLEQGRTAVFVGTAHMLNLREMLREDGFTLTQVHPTLMHKVRAWCQARAESS